MKICLVFGFLAILSASKAQEDETEVTTTSPSEDSKDSEPLPIIDLYYPVLPPVRPLPIAPAPIGPREPLRPPPNFYNQFGPNRPLSPPPYNGFSGTQGPFIILNGQRQPVFPGGGQRPPQLFNRFPDYYK